MENIDPNVITEDLIRGCIKAVSLLEGLEDRQKAVPFKHVECLIFSFKNLVRIANLQGLRSLTKLQLDNNVISRIENLGHLTNLTWLDLSFNNITKIEGLDSLTKLTDLSLFNNRISCIEGLDALVNLNAVSLGNNAIKDLDNVLYLRRFRRLRLINLEGNPFCKEAEYRPYVLAHIRDLRYLDYRLVDPAAATAAVEQFQDEMLELLEKEEAEEVRERTAQEKAAEQALLEEANLSGVESLLENMLLQDPEYPKLKQIPGLLDALPEFRDKFQAAMEEFKDAALAQHAKKAEEMRAWRAAADGALADKEEEARALVMAFNKAKKKAFREVGADPASAESRLRGPREDSEALLDRLMELEMQSVDILQDFWTEFDSHYSSVMDANKQLYSSFFSVVRGWENKFFEAVNVAAMALLERFAAGEMEDLESDDARLLLGDKDGLMNAVQASHDAHTTLIDGLEDQKVQREAAMYAALAADNKKWEIQRNRERISEIWSLGQRNRQEMEELLGEEEGPGS